MKKVKASSFSKKDENSKFAKINRWLYWLPRVLSILFILFIAMFSLDEFGNNYTFWQTVLGLFMHNIPTFFLIIFLVFAWKWEWIGAAGYVLFAVWYVLWVFTKITYQGFQAYYLLWIATIALPAFVVGVLWWLNWVKKR